MQTAAVRTSSAAATMTTTCRWCQEQPPTQADTLHGLVMLAIAALVLVSLLALLVGHVAHEVGQLLTGL